MSLIKTPWQDGFPERVNFSILKKQREIRQIPDEGHQFEEHKKLVAKMRKWESLCDELLEQFKQPKQAKTIINEVHQIAL